jgi:glycolate oxidase
VPLIEVAVLEELRAALGDIVSTAAADLEAVRADRSGRVSETASIAVVTARTAEDVQATLRIASRHRVPVVPRGAGTGLAGGAIGGAGEIVLSLLGMTAILEIDPDDELAVVQPGILNDDLNAALAPHGLWFAPDPASKAISTVGGNIATNAGGILCAKYGVTREAVLGMKIVLADGRLMTLGRRTVKGVTGYDLTALLVGSEGTLGIIVEATVRLRPLPVGPKATIGAYFATVEDAARASAAITASRLRPAAMELIGESALIGIGEYLGLDLGGHGSYLLVQLDGLGAAAEADSAVSIIRSLGGDAELAADESAGERLFSIRRAFHPAMSARGTVLIEDVAVPRSQLPAMFAAISGIERKYGIVIPTVAHAGDGNLHPNFIFDEQAGGSDVPAVVWDAADELFRACLRLGGTLTGEHGVGILKRRWLRDELGQPQVDLQREVKRVFDPLNILNPGKIF